MTASTATSDYGKPGWMTHEKSKKAAKKAPEAPIGSQLVESAMSNKQGV
jgi:hypothetical protein